ncbi:MAG: ATP phosphoribosyltransferase regulatory subunit [Phycisphaeraceae bacterium]|nr:MAG: ATP phosphoribosyltransferase regulatory subunit [Phycisphaeraceae bacterium]
MASRSFQGPKGTRDLYPEDMLRRRYIIQSWRDTSIRHGFEEIEGPTFEEAELYAVKSGEGILGELFQAFSGKSPEEVAQVQETGRAPFAMRPEFTPTLARMYAARARQLTKPTRWFMAGPFFRAERPQRGRLREFLQWNADVLGSDDQMVDRADVVSVLLASIEEVGLIGHSALETNGAGSVTLRYNDRRWTEGMLDWAGVDAASKPAVIALLDRYKKYNSRDSFESDLGQIVSSSLIAQYITDRLEDERLRVAEESDQAEYKELMLQRMKQFNLRRRDDPDRIREFGAYSDEDIVAPEARAFVDSLTERGFSDWLTFDGSIVRGLAYYTGTVFEVIAEGERAVAGGGRYDKLIELLGGPPTPAVGFAMGDVVLSLLLEDKGLMPEGPQLMDAVSRRPASVRPEAFVIGANDETSDTLVRRLVADLRRGVESKSYQDKADDRKPWQADRYEPASDGVRPMHARSSDKSTRNVKKLLGDASRQNAKFAVIIHDTPDVADRVQLKDLDGQRDLTPADIPGLPTDKAEFSVDTASDVYVGRAIAAIS